MVRRCHGTDGPGVARGSSASVLTPSDDCFEPHRSRWPPTQAAVTHRAAPIRRVNRATHKSQWVRLRLRPAPTKVKTLRVPRLARDKPARGWSRR